MKTITCSKRFNDLPFAHRQPNHSGHCSLIHGHNWSFEFEFRATELDRNGFVIDFGDLKWIRHWLEEKFDHTLVLNNDDPCLSRLSDDLTGHGALARIITVPNCGAEGLASYVFQEINRHLAVSYAGRVSLTRVTVFEDSRNSATYYAP